MLLLITDHAAAYPRAARVCIAAAPRTFPATLALLMLILLQELLEMLPLKAG